MNTITPMGHRHKRRQQWFAPRDVAKLTRGDLCINRNNHQKPTFHPLGDFLNPALALLGKSLKKSPIGQKLDFAIVTDYRLLNLLFIPMKFIFRRLRFLKRPKPSLRGFFIV
jgi:hypothetical protein